MLEGAKETTQVNIGPQIVGKDWMCNLLVSTEGACGRITLNRPGAINALTLDMVRGIYLALTTWVSNAKIEFILIDGAGDRGLCAGGDIRTLYSNAVSGNFAQAATFFREEYRLNYLIAHYPKPYIALMDGIVMGGGIGISAHGSHRVVTERSALAMPETSIGFIPDIGGTFLLGNAPEEFGTYMALTGMRIGAADAILCDLADLYVPANRLPRLVEELENSGSRVAMENCLQSFAAPPPPGKLEAQRPWISKCFAADSVEEIIQSVESLQEPEAIAAAGAMAKNSPTALKVTLPALRNGRRYGELGQCLEQEYRIALKLLRAGDFVEGVRAALVDKDHKPIWNPSQLKEVTSEVVNSFFSEAGLPQLALCQL